MDRKPTTLEEYFAKLREEPAITSGELGRMLDAPRPHAPFLSGARLWLVGLACVALIGLAIATAGGDGDGRTKRKSPRKATATRTTTANGKERRNPARSKASAARQTAPNKLGPLYVDDPEDTTEVYDVTIRSERTEERPAQREGVQVSVRLSPKKKEPLVTDVPSSPVYEAMRESDAPMGSAADDSSGYRHGTVKIRQQKVPVMIPNDFEDTKYVLPVDSTARDAFKMSDREGSRRKQAIRLNSSLDRESPSIDAVRMPELSDEDLAGLGIEIKPNGRVVIYSSGWTQSTLDPNGHQSYAACVFTADESHTVAIERSEIPAGVRPAPLPMIVTEPRGGRRLFDRAPSSIELSDRAGHLLDSLDMIELGRPYSVDNLIPIRVNLRDRVMDASEPYFERPGDIVLWYRPNDAFLERLPACMRDAIGAELIAADNALRTIERSGNGGAKPTLRGLYDSLRSHNGIIFTSCRSALGERHAGEPYLDVWRSAGGAILSSEIDPNLDGDHLQIRYRLAAPRSISVDLHDLSGSPIQRLASKRPRGAGEQVDAYSIVGVPAGVYLVVITTNQQEKAIRRVVIEE